MLMKPERQTSCDATQKEAMNSSETILRALVEQEGTFVRGAELACRAGLSRAGVWKQIVKLRGQGFQIAAGMRRGYCLQHVPDVLAPPVIEAGLRTAFMGRKIVFYKQIDSTNRVAKELAGSGACEGTVVLADEQTAGKGRLGRTWIAPPGSNILCSLILYPDIAPDRVFKLTMLASVAVVRTLQNICGLPAKIKWPNDVYVSGRKICGILTEFMADHSSIAYVVIGSGMNVNFDPCSHPDIMETATSVQAACGRPMPRVRIVRGLFHELEALYQELRRDNARALKQEWEQHSLVLGQWVDIISEHERVSGVVRGLSEEGHLMLADATGAVHEVICGDLSLRMHARPLP